MANIKASLPPNVGTPKERDSKLDLPGTQDPIVEAIEFVAEIKKLLTGKDDVVNINGTIRKRNWCYPGLKDFPQCDPPELPIS